MNARCWSLFFCGMALILLQVENVLAAKPSTIHKFAAYEMGYGTYSFPEKLDHELIFPVASLTAGLAYQRFSVVLNLSGSLADADVSEEGQYGNASREDVDLTFGYQLNKTVSLFTGYKQGQTNLLLINRDPLLPGGGNEVYKQSGSYLGVNLNKKIEGAGKLTLSVAYAALKSDNTFIADGDWIPGDEFDFDDIGGATAGDSNGYSYTLIWSMPMRGNFIFRSRLRINEYKQTINHPLRDFNNIEESSTMLLVGITRIF